MRLFKGSFFHQCNALSRHLPLVSAQRFISYWSDTDLPLKPRAVFMHQEIKRFLLENKETIPEELHELINEQLKIIRKVNWNYYNTNGVDGSKQRKELEKLLEYITVLSQMDELARLSDLKSHIQTTIDCIISRTNHEFNTFHPKY